MKMSNLRTVIADVALIVSLVFVGFEVHQNTEIARGQARQDLAALNQEWLAMMSQDVELNELWGRAFGSKAQLTATERNRVFFLVLLNLRRMENVFLQHEEGLVDESALASYGLQVPAAFLSQRFRDTWTQVSTSFDPRFVVFFNQRLVAAAQGRTRGGA